MDTEYFHDGDSDGVSTATEDLQCGLKLCSLFSFQDMKVGTQAEALGPWCRIALQNLRFRIMAPKHWELVLSRYILCCF